MIPYLIGMESFKDGNLNSEILLAWLSRISESLKCGGVTGDFNHNVVIFCFCVGIDGKNSQQAKYVWVLYMLGVN